MNRVLLLISGLGVLALAGGLAWDTLSSTQVPILQIEYGPGDLVSNAGAAVVILCVAMALAHRAHVTNRTLRREVARLNGLHDRFMQSLHHQLKNRIQIITTGLKNAASAGDNTPPIVDAQQAASRLRELTTKLSELARVSDKLELESVSLMELLEQARDRAQSDGAIGRVRPVEKLVPWPLKPVMVDADLMEQALINVVENAIKYSPADRPVLIRVQESDASTTVIVQDEGIGMDAEDESRVGEELFRGKQPEGLEVDGSGIGLAFTKRVLEAHGGKLEVESELNQGTVVRFIIPRGKR